ncbi:ABC transporter substrate-binding protein [Compostimonas suwonensis]|uniref:Multiple sugar transport system substrate-binding protein/raffinose/stachyose/melibiose transport system substrate-binding protein n=1 Tax=Compostimonas suwonensis TaxID=1048394 RepID=A0A2M9BVC2_9MICO|nr:extracellular solute-binding protein [Compostimonas suwonensis]PJJ61895.1 multiple sugar transport system substrate-binding protein/raffinose/stachyose/melibiose transport system substrate-binding protein [Compostimonas suwonensis]
MKRTRTLATLALGAAALVALSACSTSATGGSTSGTGEGDATITFMTFETPALTSSFWDTSIAEAAAAVPGLSVNKIVSPDADRNAYAKQLQASGQFPDVLSSINPKDFTEAGLLEPFDQTWLDDNFLLPDGNSIDGKTYIPPTNSQIIPMIFYNKEIFAANGLSVPTTWDEFMNVVTTLRAAGVTPLEMAGGEPWSAAIPLSGLITADVIGADPDWVQQRYAGDVEFTDENVVAAVDKYRQIIDAGGFDPGALGVNYNDANAQFLSGASAMYPMGSWFIGQIKPEDADKYGTFLLPSATGESIVPFNTGGTTSVASKSKALDDSVEFAKAWSLSTDNLKTLIETDGAFPMLSQVAFEDFGATVTPVYDEAYTFVTDDSGQKVNGFAQVNNDDALPAGLNDVFYAMSQELFTSNDVQGQLAAFDTAWDQAAGQ